MRRGTLFASLALGGGALVGAPLAFYALFSGFQEYDDEGYLLLSLREYARGGILYDEVYSQYGPVYSQLVAAIFRVTGLAFTHQHGRAFALLLLLATVVLCGVLTWRIGRSLVVAVSAELAVLLALVPSRNEPLHPGALLAFLLGGLVLAGSFLEGAGPSARRAAVVVGVLLGAMLLVKVNVGVFAVVGVGFALSTLRGPAVGRVAATGAMITLPLALMASQLGAPAVRVYLAVALAAVLGVVVATSRVARGGASRVDSRGASRDALPRPILARMVAAGGTTIVLAIGLELARGTTLTGVVEGLVRGPLRHPGAFLDSPDLGAGAVAWAATSLALALGVARARHRGWVDRPPASVALGLTQIGGGLILWFSASGLLPGSPLGLTPPLLWIALARARAEPIPLATLVLVGIAALQTLHAYPVAGTQVAWATFLAIPVGGVALVEGGRRIAAGLAAAGTRVSATGPCVLVGAGLLALTAAGAAATHRRLEADYRSAVPLGLPGAESVRVAADQAALYRFLVESLGRHCRTFITQPGLNSLYLFSGMEPPTRLNATVWMLLLSDAQQATIVERLARAAPPVCALRRQRREFTTPLARYIEEGFVTLFRIESFEFRVRREAGRPAPA